MTGFSAPCKNESLLAAPMAIFNLVPHGSDLLGCTREVEQCPQECLNAASFLDVTSSSALLFPFVFLAHIAPKLNMLPLFFLLTSLSRLFSYIQSIIHHTVEKNTAMGNCLTSSSPKDVSKKKKALPIETDFRLPSPLPEWPTGFGGVTIDLGGIHVCQCDISSSSKVWTTHEGGPENLGASFFEQSSVPDGKMAMATFGYRLPHKDKSSRACRHQHQRQAFAGQNPLRSIRFHRRSRELYVDMGTGKDINANEINFTSRPVNRGTVDMGVCVGTFVAPNSPLACLKNVESNLSCMPNLDQIDTLFKAYSPWIYFHSKETYLPSSVTWFFMNGALVALLYTAGEESKPVPVDKTGSNLPQGGSNAVNTGWIFRWMKRTRKDIGEQVGDWEHVTLRISNFNGELHRMYFSEHSGGKWWDRDTEWYRKEKWGPNIRYDLVDEIKKVEKILPVKLKSAFEKFVNGLPNEVLGEEGPTGPKVKSNWNGDEI
ncbi:hypothetical protein F3Y22_tig00012370pilonHSYRG00218 [Hibiscus syriacus]|uniref:Uncharacterized protein n=1 Tax=Hibiscus syriacus TaxID=106335 RepID=A0A6A3C467_HIBSY|nr:hypothetical protein F3Y22_tig00012370pilonHSYRG00218 [Hibiscus syriacus]